MMGYQRVAPGYYCAPAIVGFWDVLSGQQPVKAATPPADPARQSGRYR